MQQYNLGVLDRSQNFNRAGAVASGLKNTIGNIVGMAQQKKKADLRKKFFEGYNPSEDKTGEKYKLRDKYYQSKLAQNWRPSWQEEGHEGVKRIQEQERIDAQQKVKSEFDQLSLDNKRLENRMNIIKSDQFKNDEIDSTLMYMSESPEKYAAGMADLQKYFPQEVEGMGLPQEFNKDAQAKILMRKGVSERVKALNTAKMEELEKQKEKAFKLSQDQQAMDINERKMSLEEKKLVADIEKDRKDYALEIKKLEAEQKEDIEDSTKNIKLSVAEKGTLGTIAKSVESFNAVSKMFTNNELSGLNKVMPGAVAKIPIIGGKIQPKAYEYEKMKRRLAEDALRDATGAAAPNHEVRTYMSFFPDVGDTTREAQAKIEGMKVFLMGKGESVALGLEATGDIDAANSIRKLYRQRVGSIQDVHKEDNKKYTPLPTGSKEQEEEFNSLFDSID